MDTPRAAAVTQPPPVASAGSSPALSPWARLIAVFTRPADAWGGLESRAQWWFPMVVSTLVIAGLTVVLYDRAIVPMLETQWGRMVESGRLPEEQYTRMVEQVSSPMAVVNTVVWQAVSWPLILLFISLLIWFGVGFVLGTKLSFRKALEVAAWAGLIVIPSQLIGGTLGWFRGTMQGVHLGLGALVPESDPPTKLETFLATFGDALGPLALWVLVVAILGAAALSGAPRKSVVWVLGALYVAVNLFAAAMAAMFA